MSTFRIGNPRASWLLVLGLAVAAAARTTGCKNSNDITGPTAPATADISGSWTGTFTPSGPAFYAEPVSAQASLQQTGANVDGTITISGFPAVTIHATMTGAHLSGTIEDANGQGTAVGGFVSARLTIALHRHGLGGGELQLSR